MLDTSTSVPIREIASALRAVYKLAPFALWRDKHSELLRRIESNKYLEEFYREQFSLIFSLLKIQSYRQTTGRLPFDPQDYDQYAPYCFARMCEHVMRNASIQGQTKLSGAIRHGISNADGLQSLAFELDIASILLANKYDVKFVDLESDAQFDLQAARDGATFNVECKTISTDTGLPISLLETLNLVNAFLSDSENSFDSLNGGHFFVTEVEKKLTEPLKEEIRQLMKRIIELDLDFLSNENDGADNVTITRHRFDFDALPRIDYSGIALPQEHIRKFLRDNFGMKNEPGFGVFRPGRQAVMFSMRSKRESLLLERAYERLKKGGKQLPADTPGVVFIRFLGLSDDQIRELGEVEKNSVTGLSKMAARLFTRDDMKHIHSILFLGRGLPETTQLHDNAISISGMIGTNAVYHFRNKRCEYTGKFFDR